MHNTPDAPATRPPSSEKINVLLIDDSAVVRGMLRQIIDKTQDVNVIDVAQNGKVGLERYKKLNPDVVILDIEMPEMDGITTLEHILNFDPDARVIMCSSLTQSGAEITIKALNMGAADCLSKPSSKVIDRSSSFEEQFLLKIRAFKKTPTYTTPSARPVTQGHTQRVESSSPTARRAAENSLYQTRPYPNTMALSKPQVIAIGSSTGGPKALTTVLKDIDTNIDLPPIFITQHMPAGFTKILASSLEKETGHKTVEATDDMIVKRNHIYVAPGGKHLKVERRTSGIFTTLCDSPPIHFCKPAVDIMFESILETYNENILSVILTGMGSDGHLSCEKIVAAHEKNILISQDKQTSTVWGMPKAVANAGICNAIIPVNLIGKTINAILTGRPLPS